MPFTKMGAPEKGQVFVSVEPNDDSQSGDEREMDTELDDDDNEDSEEES